MPSFLQSISMANKSASAKKPVKRFTNSTQIGKNVAKVRWLGDGSTLMVPNPLAIEYFIVGTWGDRENEVSLWKLNVEGPEGDEKAQVDCIHKLGVVGDVTGMQALDVDRFAVTSSLGVLTIFKCIESTSEAGALTSIGQVSTSQLHAVGDSKIPCPATGVDVKGNSIVTVGEDGSIFETSAATSQVVRSLEQVDPLSIYSVAFTGRSEIVTGNGGGQLKVWDLRSSSTIPTQIMNPNVLLNNLYGAISIAQHPSQSHALIVGYQYGCMDLWDIRLGSGCDPVANLAIDGGSLSEIYFHRVNPDHFFSCAQTGELCQWYPSDNDDQELLMQDNMDYDTDLNIEFLKRGLAFKEVHSSPFPINSMSLSKNDRLICGGDSGILFCTELKGL